MIVIENDSIPYIDKEQWQGEEITIDNNIVEPSVTLYHGDIMLGEITNDVTMTNVLCQIAQKFHDEVKEQSMEWTDYFVVTSDGEKHKVLTDGRVSGAGDKIFPLYGAQMRRLMGF